MEFTFDPSDYEQLEFVKTLTKALSQRDLLQEVQQEVFRPARKHGYANVKVQDLLEKLGDDGYELVSELETIFLETIGDAE